MRPTRPYRALRAAVGAIAVLGFLFYAGYVRATGGTLDSLTQIVAVGIVLAGAIAVFGRRTVTQATETAESMAGTKDDEGES